MGGTLSEQSEKLTSEGWPGEVCAVGSPKGWENPSAMWGITCLPDRNVQEDLPEPPERAESGQEMSQDVEQASTSQCDHDAAVMWRPSSYQRHVLPIT